MLEREQLWIAKEIERDEELRRQKNAKIGCCTMSPKPRRGLQMQKKQPLEKRPGHVF
jgi:hypothetical protein